MHFPPSPKPCKTYHVNGQQQYSLIKTVQDLHEQLKTHLGYASVKKNIP